MNNKYVQNHLIKNITTNKKYYSLLLSRDSKYDLYINFRDYFI